MSTNRYYMSINRYYIFTNEYYVLGGNQALMLHLLLQVICSKVATSMHQHQFHSQSAYVPALHYLSVPCTPKAE